MYKSITTLLSSYENGTLSRRDLVAGLGFLVSGATAVAAGADTPITAVSVNHIAINVSDLKRSTAWYKTTLGLTSGMETEKESALRFGDSGLILRPSPKPGVITHVMFGINNYNSDNLEGWLRHQGLDPRKDQDSFHVKDPDGLDVQVGDKDMRGSSQAPVGKRHLTPSSNKK